MPFCFGPSDHEFNCNFQLKIYKYIAGPADAGKSCLSVSRGFTRILNNPHPEKTSIPTVSCGGKTQKNKALGLDQVYSVYVYITIDHYSLAPLCKDARDKLPSIVVFKSQCSAQRKKQG